jgi:hypothetical protein
VTVSSSQITLLASAVGVIDRDTIAEVIYENN